MNRYWSSVVRVVIFAGLAVLGFILVDWFCLGKSFIGEGYPDFSLFGWLRTLVLTVCSLALVVVVTGRDRPEISLGEKGEKSAVYWVGILTCLLSIFFVFLLWFFPKRFNVLSHEDYPVEWASFAFLIISAALFIIAAFRCRRTEGQRFPWAAATCAAFAFVFWFIGMEEVSWFQRQAGFETPDLLFEGNVQEEFNLHNFFTVGFEILYYFGTFVFFVALPFLRVIFSDWVERNSYFNIFVPQPFVAVLGALSCGYNFEMWNIFPVQSCFVGTVIVLGAFTLFCQRWSERFLILFIGVVMVASQWVFLISKCRYERIWEVTEYKELFITIGFVIYAISTLRQIQKSRRELV